MDQHYRRIHGRPKEGETSLESRPRDDAESRIDRSSDMDIEGSTESTPGALGIDIESTGQTYGQPRVGLSQRSQHHPNSAPLQVLRVKLDSLKAQKDRFDEAILTLEAAVAVFQGGS